MTPARLVALVLPAVVLLHGCGSAQGRDDSANDFPRIRVAWSTGSGPARLAYTSRQRSIGYRHLERREAPPAIYFRYPEPRKVHFHMRAVSFPVRAWWLDADGCALSFTDMRPGTDGHTPPEAVTAVLEVPSFRLDDYPGGPLKKTLPKAGSTNQATNQGKENVRQDRASADTESFCACRWHQRGKRSSAWRAKADADAAPADPAGKRANPLW